MYPWDQLSLFESKDLITKKYESKHGYGLSGSKAVEIISHFAQAREFFRSANTSSEMVKPLLLYYGVLSFTRGLILFQNKTSKENSLATSHGLEVLNWREHLNTQERKFNLLDIRVCNGTFHELARATMNRISKESRAIGLMMSYRWDTFGTINYPDGTVFNFKEILSRIPELFDMYCETFKENPKCYEGHVFTQNVNSHSFITFSMPRFGEYFNSENIIDDFQLPNNLEINYKEDEADANRRGPRFETILNHNEEEMERLLPETYLAYMVSKYQGMTLSKLSYLYCVSYILGMLVRYYPSHWSLLITRQSGDFMYPIIRKATNLIEEVFPTLILEELEI